LKILHIIPSLVKGGAERLVLDICHELMGRKDVEVKLLIFRNENQYEQLSEGIDITICPARVIPSITGKSVIEIDAFKKFLDDFSPDIIHSHLNEAEVVSREYILPGTVYFTHAHDNMIQFRNLKPGALLKKTAITNWYEKNRLLKRYSRITNYFIANSADTFTYLQNNLPGPYRPRIFELINAINLAAFPFCRRATPSKELRLITVGSLVPKKNHQFLFEVMNHFRLSPYAVHLDVLGEGSLKSFMLEKTKHDGMEDSITFHGNANDVFDFLSKGHVYVHSATYEPFGLAIAEAMATGLPVVCLDAGGNRGIVDDGINGFMIKSADAEKFAGKILEIVKDPEGYQSFSLRAREKAEWYDIRDYVDRLLTLYKQAFQSDEISSTNLG
jgi:glycosyltransferase involved in cell wall biosynthesis